MTTTHLDSTNFSASPPNQLPTVPTFNPDWFDNIGLDSEVENEAIADEITDKVKAAIPDPVITDDDIKPTQEQINYGKAIWILGAIALVMFGISIFQPSTQVQTSLQPQAKPTDVTTSQLLPTQSQEPPVSNPKKEPMAERDPSIQSRNVLLADTYNQASELQQQLVEARARFFFTKWQQLADRNPQSYREYLLGQWRRVNGVMANMGSKDLIGNAEQSAIASSLVVDTQAITLELTRFYVAEGKMQSPENLRDRQNISVLDPSIRLSQLAKSLHDGEYYEAMIQGADRDAEKERAIALQQQRQKTTAKPTTGLLKKP